MTDVDDRLRRAAAELPEDPVARGRARARLDEAVVAAQAPARRRRAPRLGVLAPGLALACAGLATVALWPGSDPPARGLPAAQAAARVCFGGAPAARCLSAVATVASAQEALAAGKVWFQRDRWTEVSQRLAPPGAASDEAIARTLPGAKQAFAIQGTAPQRIWIAADGSGRYDVRGRTTFTPASRADAAAWRDAGRPDLDKLMGPVGGMFPKVIDAGPGGMEELLLTGSGLGEALPQGNRPAQLPQDPEQLAARLAAIAYDQRVPRRDRGSCAPDLTGCSASLRRLVDATAAEYVLMLLRWPLTPPALRASLLRVFSGRPGTRNLGRVRDPEGREGVALLLPGDGADGLNVVLVDARSSRVLADGRAGLTTIGNKPFALAGDREPPSGRTIRWQTLYALESGAVDAIGDQPGRPIDPEARKPIVPPKPPRPAAGG